MYKKIIFVTLVLSLIVLIVPEVSIANSFSLVSSSKTIEPNKTFTLSVYVIPTSTSVYTAQANINYPADLVSVESFTYASAWFPMNQAGYDLVDNTNGKLIKTAGYPSGFNKDTLFGTLVFKSKKAGDVSISINKESFILDMDSNNVLNNYGSFSITSTSYTPLITLPVAPLIPLVTLPVFPVVTKPTTIVSNPNLKVETEVDSKENEVTSLNTKEDSLLINKDLVSDKSESSLPLELSEEIIENVTKILNILPTLDESKTEIINNNPDIKVIESELINKEKIKEEIVRLVYQDSNKDGISDYDSKYIYNMDAIKASPVSNYQGKNLTAGEKILLGFNPNKKELEKIVIEEPLNNKKDIVVNSYKVTDVSFTEKKEIVFKGQALPNSYSTLYIYSTPIIVTIKTDNNGEWQYKMDKELEDGNHTVYIATVNNTGNIIAKSTPYTFVKTAEAISLQNLVPAEVVETEKVNEPRFLQTKNIFIIIAGLLVFVGVIFTLIGLFSKKTNQEIVEEIK